MKKNVPKEDKKQQMPPYFLILVDERGEYRHEKYETKTNLRHRLDGMDGASVRLIIRGHQLHAKQRLTI